jgi:hypothetical protein
MRGWPRTSHAALAALLVGAAMLFLASATYLRVIGATILVAGIAIGVFAIATPARLGEDPPPEETTQR